MSAYPPIADHGLIGDLQTVALVSSAGTVDWWCTPRFDSPSIFGSLLDQAEGGHCHLAVDLDQVPDVTVKQLYLADTATLLTRFMTPDGVGEVADYMVPDPSPEATDRHRLHRTVRVVRGTLPFTLEVRPRFDYGRAPHTLKLLDESTALMQGPGTDLFVQTSAPITLTPDGQDAVARFTLAAGEVAAVVLTADATGGPRPDPLNRERALADFDRCRGFWHDWLHASTYRGRWQGW